MGSPTECYNEVLRNYISLVSDRSIKYDDSNLLKSSSEELEQIASEYLKGYENYGLRCFYLGVSVGEFVEDNDNNCDRLNAFAAALPDLLEFFNIRNDTE